MLALHVRGLGFDTGERKWELFAGKFNPVHFAVLREHLAAARRLPRQSGSLWGQKQLFKRDSEENRLQLEDMGN